MCVCHIPNRHRWHKKGSVLVTTAPAASTKHQNWDRLALEVFPFPLAPSPHALRTTTAHLYDTKVDTDRPPHTTVVLEQDDEGRATLRVGASTRDRTWRVRVHLPPGYVAHSAGVDGEDVQLHLAMASGEEEGARALVDPTRHATAEVVLTALSGRDHVVTFSLARAK